MDTKKHFSVQDCRLYGVTAHTPFLLEQVRAAITGGITMLQIREKNCSTEELVQMARPILAVCHDAGIPCLINDDVYAAKQLGADGVHVGQHDMGVEQARQILGERAVIGTSAHNVEEAIRAQEQGADYIGCGAVFPSDTKADTTPLSHQTLCEIQNAVSIPVVAIGGIQAGNVHQLAGTGIDGIAVVSALFSQQDVTQAARTLRTLADEICRKGNTA